MFLKVRIIAGAKKEEIIESDKGSFVMHIREPAERNLANKRMLEILRKYFPGREIRIINGHHSPQKLISIED
jgi:uncharacterized protein (TIGR00251 family)